MRTMIIITTITIPIHPEGSEREAVVDVVLLVVVVEEIVGGGDIGGGLEAPFNIVGGGDIEGGFENPFNSDDGVPPHCFSISSNLPTLEFDTGTDFFCT